MIDKTKRSIQWIPILNKKTLEKERYAGIHLIAEFWFGNIIETKKELKEIMIGAVLAGNCTPLEIVIHKFKPQGITGVVLLEESHLSIHTWPEWGYVAIDVFTCGDKVMPHKAIEYLKKQFNPKKVEMKEIIRGVK